jgi:hypothetical protein
MMCYNSIAIKKRRIIRMDKIAKIKSVMRELGITPDLKGYHYTERAVIMLNEDFEEGNIPRGATTIYNEVGKHFGQTGTSIERCLRYSVDVATRNKTALFEFLFGNLKTVTVSNFISVIAEYIR